MLEPTSSHWQQDFRVAQNGESLRVNPRVAAGLLVGLAVVAHLPGFGGAFIWDDDAHVTESRAVVDPGGLSAIWFEPGSVPQYYPLTHSSFWLEYRLWGDNPTGYHATDNNGQQICWNWNRRTRTSDPCPRSHVCAFCFGDHRAPECDA